MRSRIAGVDEAGRGPLAGPVVAAAVVLRPGRGIDGLADSKVLDPREAHRARRGDPPARALPSASAGPIRAEIDALNILHATFLAMRRAVLAMHVCSAQAHRRRQPAAAARRPGCAAYRPRHHRRRCDRARDQRRLDPGEDSSRSVHGSDGRARSRSMRSRATRAMRRASTGGGSASTGRAACIGAASPRCWRSWAASPTPRSGTPIWNGFRTSTRIPSSRPTWSVRIGPIRPSAAAHRVLAGRWDRARAGVDGGGRGGGACRRSRSPTNATCSPW